MSIFHRVNVHVLQEVMPTLALAIQTSTTCFISHGLHVFKLALVRHTFRAAALVYILFLLFFGLQLSFEVEVPAWASILYRLYVIHHPSPAQPSASIPHPTDTSLHHQHYNDNNYPSRLAQQPAET